MILAFFAQACSGPALEPWHRERLTAEFSVGKSDEIRSFDDYRALEDRLFRELDQRVYTRVGTGPSRELVRYSAGSASDPRNDDPDWNRSFEFTTPDPVGAVLLLHGMSDSPYSLRALGQTLHRQGYWVLGLRLPGHGTAPSGLKYVRMADMIAAVRLATRHLATVVGEGPLHLVGYSTGAALALDFALDSVEGRAEPVPASLVLISPAIRVHPTAGAARFKNALSALPAMGGLAWLQIRPEFDPYKYNSFATNAADIVHRLTRSVDARVGARGRSMPDHLMPPTLVVKSAVDATVTTEAVIDRLLMMLQPRRHELLLFDINRSAAKSILLVDDPGPLTSRLMRDATLPFRLTVVTNEDPGSSRVVSRLLAPFSGDAPTETALGLAWPPGVISLSHVALPFPPDDPLYGGASADGDYPLSLGNPALRGETGLLALPADWLLRMRYNPFYQVLEERVLAWFANHTPR
jgi:alpha-beta hydrolase superfamily lysophospholipase